MYLDIAKKGFCIMLPIYDKVLQQSHSMKHKKIEGLLVILTRPKPLLKAASHKNR